MQKTRRKKFVLQREAFILSDTCGNIDGSTGNLFKNVMFGKIDNAIEYHNTTRLKFDRLVLFPKDYNTNWLF